MKRILLSDIEARAVTIDYLEVQSYEMNIYLVFVCVGSASGLVYGDNGRPYRFKNATQIRDTFAHCNVVKSVMKHDSPYDEMIGNPAKAVHAMALPFSMAMPY